MGVHVAVVVVVVVVSTVSTVTMRSLVHALMCMSRTGTSGRGKRHSHVQHTTEHAIHQNVPTCTIAPGAPSYDTFFQRRGAAPANGKIQKADFLISYEEAG